jgi:hypothetical protein
MLIALLLSLFHCLFIDISIFRLKKAGYSGRSSAKQIAAHPGLLLEEKVPSTARRMRWRNRDRRNPPHPAGCAARPCLLLWEKVLDRSEADEAVYLNGKSALLHPAGCAARIPLTGAGLPPLRRGLSPARMSRKTIRFYSASAHAQIIPPSGRDICLLGGIFDFSKAAIRVAPPKRFNSFVICGRRSLG